jgi:polyisoprenoid-binding protein YceI
MKAITLLAAAALACPLGAHAELDIFNIDSTHSFANWEIRHVVAHTTGTFHDIKGQVRLDTTNLANSSVEANISLYSLNSSNPKRDVHLLTDEFLDAHAFPDMHFASTDVLPVSASKGTMHGFLTLHGVTKVVAMEYQILGIGADPWGGVRAGFKADTRIKRSDFGISKYAANGPMGDEVEITLLIEGIQSGADGQPVNLKKAAEERARAVVYPMPAAAQAAPIAQPVPPTPPSLPTQPASPGAQPATSTSPPASDPNDKKNLEDQLRKKLKGLFK